MRKINKFLFCLGLFTVNAFRYNWRAIVFPTLIIGTAASWFFGTAWQFIPSFIGSYLAVIHDEYIDYKKVKNAQDTYNRTDE
jgi:uncharacterized membrane protein